MAKEITNLQQLLNRIEETTDDPARIYLGTIVEAVGARSFGSLLLMIGVVTASPVSGIPGVPTIMALLLLLISVQLILGRRYFWLPAWLLKRSMARDRVCKVLKWLRPPARFIDRLLQPRLSLFVEGASVYIIAVVCAVIAIGLPVMEMVPFSAHTAGLALTAFGLSLIARDGLLALIAFVVTAITFGLALLKLLS